MNNPACFGGGRQRAGRDGYHRARQRTKSLDELPREEVVSLDPQAAYQALLEHRRRKSDKSDFSALTVVETTDPRRRKTISRAKEPLLAPAGLPLRPADRS